MRKRTKQSRFRNLDRFHEPESCFPSKVSVKQKTTLNTGFNEPESRSCLYEPNLRSSKAFIKASSSFLILKRLIKNVEELY